MSITRRVPSMSLESPRQKGPRSWRSGGPSLVRRGTDAGLHAQAGHAAGGRRRLDSPIRARPGLVRGGLVYSISRGWLCYRPFDDSQEELVLFIQKLHSIVPLFDPAPLQSEVLYWTEGAPVLVAMAWRAMYPLWVTAIPLLHSPIFTVGPVVAQVLQSELHPESWWMELAAVSQTVILPL